MLLGGIISVQMIFSSILKSHDHVKKAVLIDAGVLLLLFAYTLSVMSTNIAFKYDFFEKILCFCLITLLIISFFYFKKYFHSFSSQRYKQALNYGRHIILSAFLIVFLTTGGRILIEYFFDLAVVGYYTFYVRFATPVVML